MRRYVLERFGLEHLRMEDAPEAAPGPGQVAVDIRAFSLNYRDLLVVKGLYNPKFALPAVPASDGSGIVSAVGPGVTRVKPGDRVVTQFIAGWLSGTYRGEYQATTLGMPGPGVAAERVVLDAEALLPIPAGHDFAEAATLPIAALTAWSALFTAADLQPGHTVLTLGTGGVSVFALQIAKAAGARVIITSSSDEKLERARRLGADHTINYRANANWDKQVLDFTGGEGADITVETVGGASLERSIRATRAGGVIGLLGVLAGVKSEITAVSVLMKRLTIAGILVDSRAAFEKLLSFVVKHRIRPLIDQRFRFEQLPEALRLLESGAHMGKIVLER